MAAMNHLGLRRPCIVLKAVHYCDRAKIIHKFMCEWVYTVVFNKVCMVEPWKSIE